MRTTVTLDPDVECALRDVVRERGVSFKEALNDAIRGGLRGKQSGRSRKFTQATFRMGAEPEIRRDKALALAASIEDEELSRKLALRK